ncbi:MAG TPA: carboxypeptidase-like regulatory domain-containing protein [Candidatus Acidoferrales bacterium]|nr:carboxypeptidase-like regulatory domain-containing protein [Candidatus Acidoferrales bacterium]
MTFAGILQSLISRLQAVCLPYEIRRALAPWRAISAVAALALLFASAAPAQSTSQLNGSVTDPSGAAVPNAKITLTAGATGLQRATTSNRAGLYEFLDVPPGVYRLDASASGFAGFTAQDVTLVVNTPSTINIKLQLAGGTTTVTVEGTEPLINKTDASLGNVLQNSQISELPIADRNVVQLLSLQPGVAYLGNQLDASTDTRSGAVNGLRSDQSNVTLDNIGVNDQNNGFAFTSVLNVPPDSVQEFRVTTADPQADSGYSSGAQVALVTKSGTNKFHGSAYEYNRTTNFSANDWFLKQAQEAAGQPNKAQELIRNVFGGTLGGPIVKDHVFFFLNYEGRRDAQGFSELRTVPSASIQQGDILYLCANTSACSGGTVNGVSNVPAGYYALNSSQLTAMDPGSASLYGKGPSTAVEALLNQYPASNALGGDGVNTLGFRFSSPADAKFNTYIARIDWQISRSETLFWRGQTENINQPGVQQFPGQPPASALLDDSKGSILGLTSILSPSLINDIHWGFIRQGGQEAGASIYPGVLLNDVNSLTPFTRSTIFFVPVHQISDTLTKTHGNHTMTFGTDLFLIRNNRASDANSFSDVQSNVVYVNTAGYSEPNNPSPLNPANNGYPTVDPSFAANYDSAVQMLLGIFGEGDGVYNFDRSGNALNQGDFVKRRYAVNDYEFFGQDAWRITPRLTVTYGLRWVLEAPPYETNGLQVAPCVQALGGGCTKQNVAQWFNNGAALAAQGQPVRNAGELTFVLGGPQNNGPGLWNWDYKDFSPRISVAWSPDTGDGIFSKILGPKDRFSIRGGYSIMYDHFGIPIVNTFDQHGSFGLSTDIGNPAGVVDPAVVPRFTCLTPASGQPITACLPPSCPASQFPSANCLFGPTPSGSFPFTPSSSAFAINWGLDQSIKTPYTHVYNLSLSRQITSNSALQISYVGTVARRLPMQVDLAMPVNMTDPSSGMTYFQAAKTLSQEVVASTNYSQVQPIPFFENMFPGWSGVTQSQLAGSNLDCASTNQSDPFPATPTATQAIYDLWTCYVHNETFALFLMDLPNSVTGLNTPNSKLGPYAFYHDQFSSLYSWRNIGTSDYNALQVTYNLHLGSNLQAQFNYTFGKSLDEASAAERIGPYEGTGGTGNDLNGGGIVINSYDPLSLRGLSDFNAKHQINANGVYRLPFGKGQRFAGSAGTLLDEVIGGWQVSGVFRWTTGFPITVDNTAAWATNWNIEGDAEPIGAIPATGSGSIDSNGNPFIFKDPATAIAAFRYDWPGESGVRNNIIGQGIVNLDTGLSKNFRLWEDKRLEFSWQSFNATNAVRFDVRSGQPALSQGPLFGLYTKTLTTPRFMQFALRFVF